MISGHRVMSCRAFSRRIEFALLAELFRRFLSPELVLDFAVTSKNGPLRTFVKSLTGAEPEGGCAIVRDRFDSACPKLYQRVIVKGVA
jgi:predicted enzyme involved in methoxymalonyl-ACP biosynthesis